MHRKVGRDDLKEWFRVRDSYGVEVATGEDVPLILAITFAIDALTPRLNRPALSPGAKGAPLRARSTATLTLLIRATRH